MQKKQSKKRKITGQSLAEYGFILALITVVCLAALQLLGQNIGDLFNKIAASVSSIPTPGP